MDVKELPLDSIYHRPAVKKDLTLVEASVRLDAIGNAIEVFLTMH